MKTPFLILTFAIFAYSRVIYLNSRNYCICGNSDFNDVIIESEIIPLVSDPIFGEVIDDYKLYLDNQAIYDSNDRSVRIDPRFGLQHWVNQYSTGFSSGLVSALNSGFSNGLGTGISSGFANNNPIPTDITGLINPPNSNVLSGSDGINSNYITIFGRIGGKNIFCRYYRIRNAILLCPFVTTNDDEHTAVNKY